MRHFATAVLACALLAATPHAQAGDFEIQLGASDTKDQGGSGTVWVQSIGLEDSIGQSGRWQRESVGTVGYINGRSEPGYGDNVWLLGVGQRIRHVSDGSPSHWFVEANLLGAVGRTPAISGPVQFGTALGWSGDRYQVLIRHVSNAGLRSPNRGETMLLLGASF
jgi:hypothetical protein